MRRIIQSLLCCSFLGITLHAQTRDPLNDMLNGALNADAIFAAEIDEAELEGTVVRTLVSRDVKDKAKTYSARVENCAKGLQAVRVAVTRADVTVEDGGARFTDGSVKTLSLGRTFHAGYVSPWISFSMLGAGSRCVASVFVNAHAAHAGESSHVEVQGRFAAER